MWLTTFCSKFQGCLEDSVKGSIKDLLLRVL